LDQIDGGADAVTIALSRVRESFLRSPGVAGALEAIDRVSTLSFRDAL
jgi:hypothetical protein